MTSLGNQLSALKLELAEKRPQLNFGAKVKVTNRQLFTAHVVWSIVSFLRALFAMLFQHFPGVVDPATGR